MGGGNLMPRYKEILESLEKSIEDLKNKGITVDALNHAMKDLVAHKENIEKVENNIDAVRKEVISPIERELQQNRTAGKFSIWGFWVGALSMVVSIATISLSYLPFIHQNQSMPFTASSTNSDIMEGDRVLPQITFKSRKYSILTCVDLTSKAPEINNKPIAIANVSVMSVADAYPFGSRIKEYIQLSIADSSGNYNRVYAKKDTPLGDFFLVGAKVSGNIYGLVENSVEAGALIVDGWKPLDKDLQSTMPTSNGTPSGIPTGGVTQKTN